MIKSKQIYSFFKRNVCDEDQKNASMLTKLKKLYENRRIEENEKQLSKVPRVRTWSREASSNFAIPTISNWWDMKDLSKLGSISNAFRKLFVIW